MMAILDLERDLNDHLQEEETERFVIDTDKKADWALRKIREAEAQIEKVRDFAEERKAEIDAWAESATKREAENITFFTGLLLAYHSKLYTENPRIKTIKLPAGELQMRKTPTKYSRDEAKLTAWLKEHRPEFVKVKESPDWAAVKKVLKESGRHMVDPDTGELVDGVEVFVTEEPTFRVRTKREGD